MSDTLFLANISPRRKIEFKTMHRVFIRSASFVAVAMILLGLPDRVWHGARSAASAATTFTVVNTNDSGLGSLRQAILDANANGGQDTIAFNIPGTGVRTITVISALPTISDPIIIDGYTQPGTSVNTQANGDDAVLLVELSGGPQVSQAGLFITAGSSTVRGLVINHFNYGIWISTSGGNLIEGNFIGTNATGTTGLGSGDGINISLSTNNIIGGTTSASRNVISGNGSVGIWIGTQAGSTTIQGNFIGTNASGTAALGNGSGGIFCGGLGGDTIGGTNAGAGNVISGNQNNSGISLQTRGLPGTIIQANLIGTDVTGTKAIGNSVGVWANFAANNTIGGQTPAARNIISGNRSTGLLITDDLSRNNQVQGNFIGSDISGGLPLGNGNHGVKLSAAINNQIGGNLPGAGNTIAFNAGSGIFMEGGTGNAIRRNSIFSNTGLGIDLNGEGVTPNDAGDVDPGANGSQNFPLITSVIADVSQTTITGTLNSTPNTTFSIHFYSNAACDSSGNGEGATPFGFGSTPVATDSSGNGSFGVAISTPLAPGRVITATATDPAGNTSEFSPCDSSRAVGSVQFSGQYRVIEDVGFVTVTVLRTGGSFGSLTVSYSTADITALGGQDYAATSGVLTFNDGDTSKTFDVPIFDDAVIEQDETFALFLSNTAMVDSLGVPNRLTVTVQDDSTVPQLSISNGSITEGNIGATNAVFTVALSAATGRNVSANFNTAGLNATSGVDFQPVSGIVNFDPRATTQTIMVPVIGDTLDEVDEQFSVIPSNPTNATLGNAGIGTIFDDDPPPSVSVNDVSVAEGNSDTVFANFTVTLSNSSGKSVCVQAATADGTALAGNDYFPLGTGITNPPAFLFFDNGATSSNLTIQVRGDAQFESDETFFVNLTPCNGNVTIGDGQGVGTILNDDGQTAPTISINDVAVSDGSGPANAVFNVTLSASTTQTVTVNYTTASGTAMSDVDFQTTSGVLTFIPGVTAQSISVPVIPDSLTEGNETFTVNLGQPINATLADTQGLGTISDGPAVLNPSLSINDITVIEGDNGNASVDFTVTLSNPNGQQISFQFAVAPGSATTNIDYGNVFGALLFGPGQTVRTISVPIIGDLLDEPDETFFVNLSNATNGATFADAQGQATILDNDPPPTISINDVFLDEGNSGNTSANFLVSLSSPSGKPISVDFVTANDTALAGVDYQATSSTLTFSPGETTKPITVTVIGDTANENEPTEFFFVHLSNPSNVVIADGQGLGGIVNYVTPAAVFFSSQNSVNEGANASVSVLRTGSMLGTLSVDYFLVEGTASQRTDFIVAAGTLTFAPGETSKNVPVLIIDDVYADSGEQLTVVLSNPQGGGIGPINSTTLTIFDSDTSTPTTNPLDTTSFFIRQHYYDFLSRDPDPGGLGFWTSQIDGACAPGDTICLNHRRKEVSDAFFFEPEFQKTGGYVFRLYRSAYGNNQPTPNPDPNNPIDAHKLPSYSVFIADRAKIIAGPGLAQSQLALANALVQRTEFIGRYPASLDGPAFVDSLLAAINSDSGADLTSQRNALISLFDSGGRGLVLYRIADDSAQNPVNNRAFIDAEYRRTFVYTEYAGYLRRDSDVGGFLFWLSQVNQFPLRDPSIQHTMACAFITSAEYQQRFSPMVTRTNQECGQ